MFFSQHFDPTPFHALRSVQRELERLLVSPGLGRSTPMACALYARDNALLLRTPLPGVEAQNISLAVDGNAVTLEGEWPNALEAEQATAQHLERPRGKFSRTLRLPFEIDAGRVQARMQNGILEVEIPRLEKTPPVKIQVLSEGRRN